MCSAIGRCRLWCATIRLSSWRFPINAALVTVMSNDLNIAWELADASGLDVELTGGLLSKQSLPLQGS